MPEILNGPSFSKYNNPKKLIFMLHGYGDNATNFLHLAHPIDNENWQAQYVSLNAPSFIEGNPTGYQWFNLYPNGVYISEAGPNEFEQIKSEINNSVIKIINTIENYCNELNLTFEDCILMGFSQGGMMTFEVGNYLQKPLAALAILSGRIMSDKPIQNSTLQNIPIFISHGKNDEVIPIANYYKATEYLKSNDCKLESYILNKDSHNISPETINLLQRFIKKII
jgi:phospholipase/carboxylesterase